MMVSSKHPIESVSVGISNLTLSDDARDYERDRQRDRSRSPQRSPRGDDDVANGRDRDDDR